MSIYLAHAKELQTRANDLLVEQRKLMDALAVEKRAATAEEQQKLDRIDKEMDDYEATAERYKKLATRDIAMNADPVNKYTEDEEKRKLESKEDYFKLDTLKRRATKRYNVEYRNWLRFGEQRTNPTELRALSMDVDTQGGYLLAPQQLSANLIKNLDDALLMRQLCDRETLTGAHSLGIPVRVNRMSDAEWTSELPPNLSPDTQLTFGKREMKPHQLMKLAIASEKLLEHSVRNVEDIIRAELAYAFGSALENAYMTGNGVDKPLGIFFASDAGIPTSRDVEAGSTTLPTADGFLNAFYSLKEQYRSSPSAAIVMHRERVRDFRKLKDANNQYLWIPAFQDGSDKRIGGMRVVISEFAPSAVTASGYFAVMGDFRQYRILDTVNTGIKRLNELYALAAQVGFRGLSWHDGAPVLAEAFTRLKYAAA